MQPQQPQYQPPPGQWQQAHTMPVAPQQPAYFQQQPTMVAPPPPPKKKGVVWRVVGGIVAGVVAFLVVGALLSSRGEEPAAVPDQAAQVVSNIPKPDGQQTEDLLYGLREINSELDRARSVDRARNVCLDILANKDKGTLAKNAQYRFSGGDVQLTLAEAERIVALVESGGWCRATA